MSAPERNNGLIISHKSFTIEISKHSGFCFGVVSAIKKVEDELNKGVELYSIGSIVHNNIEVNRLSDKGLTVITPPRVATMQNKTVLFRAHGEPPESYSLVRQSQNRLVDATCPVVLKLQERIKKAHEGLIPLGGQIVIFGKKGHAEVVGLMGQTNYTALLVQSEDDLGGIDYTKPIEVFAQTTMAVNKFIDLAGVIRSRAKNSVKIHDTICRQVSNREKQLSEFSKRFDTVFFVGDTKSSNSKVLFKACKQANANSYFICSPNDIDVAMLNGNSKFGICGATSTPMWLMKEVAYYIKSAKAEQLGA